MDTSLGLPQRISKDPTFRCNCCGKNHTKQAFISHASKDKGIVEKIRKACCASKVAPYLYEFSDEFSASNVPADILAKKVEESEFIFVVLGDSVSKAYWTQAWIGFEIGVAVGVNNATEMKCTETPKYFSRRIVVIQDVRQGIEVSIPRLDALFLFDFDSPDGWNEYEGMVSVLSRIPELNTFFKIGKRFQQSTMKANVKCGYCKSQYEAWITIEDAPKLGMAFNGWLPNTQGYLAECTIECPSCDKMVTRVFRQALGVKRLPHTFMSSATNFLRRKFPRIFSQGK